MLSVNDWKKWLDTYGHLDPLWMTLLVIASVGLLWNGWSLVDRLLNPLPLPTIAVPYKVPLPAAKTLTFPFFGVYIPDINHAAVVESKLTQKVVGILYALDPAVSQVVLRTDAGFDKIYREGDSIAPDIQIKAIQPTGIILLHHGQLEKLNLPKATLLLNGPPPPMNTNKQEP